MSKEKEIAELQEYLNFTGDVKKELVSAVKICKAQQKEIEALKEKLEIATEALKDCDIKLSYESNNGNAGYCKEVINQVLEQLNKN